MKSKNLKVLSVLAASAMLFACNTPTTSSTGTSTSNTSVASSTTSETVSDSSVASTTSEETSSTVSSEEASSTVSSEEASSTVSSEEASSTVSSEETSSVVSSEETSSVVSSADPIVEISTIAQAQAETDETKTVTVKGVVVAATTQSIMIADGTGKIVVFFGGAHTNTVGQYLQVAGTLTARNGNMQYTSTATISVITDESAPTITETPEAWGATAIDTFVATDPAARGIGHYVTITGKLNINGYYYNLAIDGTANEGSISYIPTSLSTGLVNGGIYSVTGYVTDVSGSNTKYVNIFATAVDAADYSPITSYEISGDAAISITAGLSRKLSTAIAPITANDASTWTSSDETVATVAEDGTVTALAAGETTITATAVGVDASGNHPTDTVTVTVTGVAKETTTVGFIASGLGMTNQEAFSSWNSADRVVSITASIGTNTNSNVPAYFNSGTALRFYAGNTMTINIASGYEIVSIKITSSTSYPLKDQTTITNGTLSGEDPNVEIIPTVNTDAVTISKSGSSGHFRVVALDVIYAAI